MSIINGLRKTKTWEWILIFIFLATIFLFRFKYVIVGTTNLVRINRITGIAKVYIWDYASGKFKLQKPDEKKYELEEIFLERKKKEKNK